MAPELLEPTRLTTRPHDAAEPPVTTQRAPLPDDSVTTPTDADLVPPTVPRYEVVSRTQGPPGDTVVVLLDPSSYGSLSDIDLQSIVTDIYEQFPPVFEAHIVDAPAAASFVVQQGPQATEVSTLAGNYLARLEEGFRIVFLGPFAEFGTASLGS